MLLACPLPAAIHPPSLLASSTPPAFMGIDEMIVSLLRSILHVQGHLIGFLPLALGKHGSWLCQQVCHIGFLNSPATIIAWPCNQLGLGGKKAVATNTRLITEPPGELSDLYLVFLLLRCFSSIKSYFGQDINCCIVHCSYGL